MKYYMPTRIAKIKIKIAGHWWLTPVILVTWETEIRKIRFMANLGK
jgi:hypothetical protein